ncbi:MAG: hypothetical protein ABI273_16260 [Lacunisphaera sp.]
MKTALFAALLVLSLAGNAIQLIHRSDSTTGLAAGAAIMGKSDHGNMGETEIHPVKAGAMSAADGARFTNLWASIESGDAQTMADRLRAAGFPPSLIRALISARIAEQFSARRKALLAQMEDKPFWKSGSGYFADPKTMAALRDLSREQSNLLKQVLGPDGPGGSDEAAAYRRRQFGDLPQSKADQVQSILSDYNDLRNQVYLTANGVILPEDREKLALLEKEQRSDLGAALTPEELENYQLRSSPTANSMRSQLALFSPTEDEFRAIFDLQQSFDDKYGSTNMMTAASYRDRQTHQPELLDQVKNVLTPDRFAAYAQAVDPAYQTVNRLVARLDLPASAATDVVGVQKDISSRASAVRSDPNLTRDVKNAQLSALADEATGKLNVVLGARGLEAYKQFGGQWVQNLAPRPVPAK